MTWEQEAKPALAFGEHREDLIVVMLLALSGVVVGYGSTKACGIFAFPLQAEQAQLSQLLLVHHLIQPHLRCLLRTCSNISVSFLY